MHQKCCALCFNENGFAVKVSKLDSALAKMSPEFTNEELDLFKKLVTMTLNLHCFSRTLICHFLHVCCLMGGLILWPPTIRDLDGYVFTCNIGVIFAFYCSVVINVSVVYYGFSFSVILFAIFKHCFLLLFETMCSVSTVSTIFLSSIFIFSRLFSIAFYINLF